MTTRNIPPERATAMLSLIKEFQYLSPGDIEIIANACQWHRYDAGSEIVRYHDHTNSAFFIVQGEIRVMYHGLSGQEVILCDLLTGEMFGELTAIDGHPRSATVKARTSVLLASMSAADFQNLIYSNRQIAETILKRLTGQVRRLTERVYDYSTLAVRNRIQVELLRLAREHVTSENTAIISPAPTQTEIANLVSTHREAVSRELNNLVKDKLIMRQGHDLHILDVAKLTDMVNEVRGGF
ncbi:Crp/Fnr family transcriptional regulator [Nitrosomonas sp.]|uniref:Crp/Fnr family transcriptional regulator n=1 Tax=Nitrosomonas sp. TaxID=42353 RepID=UPI001DEE177A|nr:Crp/Fnr family transcriptional regulator [Nitrosomonas sp.]MBX3615670.1 Crp/Fnr family transcriptional regulator [Nitrosomonas sp.]